MKHIIVIALTLFLAVFVMAQERNYISTCGKTKTSVKWSEEHKDGKIYLNTIQGNERHEYILDNGYKTESWKIINPVSNTSLTVSLKNGKYSISGKFNGKPISKTVKSKGKPWYQNIAYNAGLTLKNGKSLEYECFRPDNIKLYIEVSLTGFMSAFWSCDYYFDTATLMFVGYKGVNGGPGTPETKISISR